MFRCVQGAGDLNVTIELVSLGDEAPSGANLEYDSVFTDLELAAQPGEERQVGDEIIEAEPADPKEIIEKAEAVLAQSHDLRAAVLLAHGELLVNGLPGLRPVTAYIRGCLEQFWETCHPQLDADDDDDPTMRVNALRGLVDGQGVLRALRMAPLTQSPAFGRLSLRDIAIAEGEIAAPADMDNPPDPTRIAAAFQDSPPEVLAGILDAARGVLEDIQAIDAVFDEKLPGEGPDLEPILKQLKRAVARLGAEVGTEDATEEGEGEIASTAPGAVPVAAVPGQIRTPRDVEQAIDRIIDYYHKHEPSSPLPILMHRARRLVGADFLTILQDLAPAGTENVRLVGGIAEDEDA